MKLYKKKILNVNVGKCLLVSLITFVIRYFYANVYLGFHNSLVTITEGVRSQIYFGGILIDHSFDLISLSFFTHKIYEAIFKIIRAIKTTLYSARSIQCLISIRTIFFIIFTKRA